MLIIFKLNRYARLSLEPYDLLSTRKWVHLTNAAVQKTHPCYKYGLSFCYYTVKFVIVIGLVLSVGIEMLNNYQRKGSSLHFEHGTANICHG